VVEGAKSAEEKTPLGARHDRKQARKDSNLPPTAVLGGFAREHPPERLTSPHE